MFDEYTEVDKYIDGLDFVCIEEIHITDSLSFMLINIWVRLQHFGQHLICSFF